MEEAPHMSGDVIQNTGDSAATVAAQTLAARAFAKSAALRRKAINAGDVADFVDWQIETFGRTNIFGSREQLWEALLPRVQSAASPLHCLEFGVAHGYASQWWLGQLTRTDLRWHGFDRFTGLPRSWRRHDEGAFDAGGTPPAIDDARATWHIGDVEDTVLELDLDEVATGSRLILFDLDLYEPTLVAWNVLGPLLKPGDVLYFDEAIDDDERRILNEELLPNGTFEYVGASSLGLGLVVS